MKKENQSQQAEKVEEVQETDNRRSKIPECGCEECVWRFREMDSSA